MELMAHEMQVRPGPVPDGLDGAVVGPGQHLLIGDEFLLREPDFAFHYRRGSGVTVARTGAAEAGEEALFLSGSVYAAVACINGLMPIHASAVAVGGKVVAFTGQAGAGKSTLAAALSQLGLPLFCDDTLLLAPGSLSAVAASAGDAVTCLPGHKRMKLWPDAAELTGSVALDEVSASYRKVYVTPGGGDVAKPLPLGALLFLEVGQAGEEARIVPLTGGEKIARLDDDHYTRTMFDSATRHGRHERFVLQARIAREVTMARFVRGLNREQFWSSTHYLAEYLSAMCGS